MPRLPGRYAAIGYVVSKLVLPVIKRRMRRKATKGVVNTGKASARAARSNPAKTSIAVGSVMGAVGYLLKRRRRGGGDAQAESPGRRGRRAASKSRSNDVS